MQTSFFTLYFKETRIMRKHTLSKAGKAKKASVRKFQSAMAFLTFSFNSLSTKLQYLFLQFLIKFHFIPA